MTSKGSKDNDQHFSIEKAFEEVNQLIERLEDPKLSLAESMDLYKKGVELLDQCGKNLDLTEKELIILQEAQES